MKNEYLKETHKDFVESKDKAWDLWTLATNVSIFMNTSLFDKIPDIESLRSQLWDLRERLEMVDEVTLLCDKDKKYHYMVVFEFASEGYLTPGTGRAFVKIDETLDNEEAVKNLESRLTKKHECKSLIITNIIELRG